MYTIVSNHLTERLNALCVNDGFCGVGIKKKKTSTRKCVANDKVYKFSYKKLE
jgi:hypothetical protein